VVKYADAVPAPSDDTFQARDLAAMAGAALVLIAAIAIDGHNHCR
jgi:hypothetical protein